MARSAKRPSKKAPPRSRVLQDGALALGGVISRNPVLVGGSTAFLVTLFYVSANALWYQPYLHKGAFFATRGFGNFPHADISEPETTINIVRPPLPTGSPAAVQKIGDPQVEQVQSVLRDLNFYSGTVDGLTGPNTHNAIMAYQKKIGLPATGQIDDALLKELDATPTTASVVPVPRPDINAPAQKTASAEQTPANADQRIIKIQAGLKAFGNDDMHLDGVVGTRTKAAIREFQSLFGLPVTGEPDETVYAKMREVGLTD
jgi:peptidoglycan hydrolase-like protein with peptidoglycan-binding domain